MKNRLQKLSLKLLALIALLGLAGSAEATDLHVTETTTKSLSADETYDTLTVDAGATLTINSSDSNAHYLIATNILGSGTIELSVGRLGIAKSIANTITLKITGKSDDTTSENRIACYKTGSGTVTIDLGSSLTGDGAVRLCQAAGTTYGGITLTGDNSAFEGEIRIDGNTYSRQRLGSTKALGASSRLLIYGSTGDSCTYTNKEGGTLTIGSVYTDARSATTYPFRFKDITNPVTLEVGALNKTDDRISIRMGEGKWDATNNKAAGSAGKAAIKKVGTGTLELWHPGHQYGTEIAGGTILANSVDALNGYTDGTTTKYRTETMLKFSGGTLKYGKDEWNLDGTAAETPVDVTTDWSHLITGSTGPVSIDTNGKDITYATALAASNVGGLIKKGAGTLDLTTAESLYTGSTIVSNGTLNLKLRNTYAGTWPTLVFQEENDATLNLEVTMQNTTTTRPTVDLSMFPEGSVVNLANDKQAGMPRLTAAVSNFKGTVNFCNTFDLSNNAGGFTGSASPLGSDDIDWGIIGEPTDTVTNFCIESSYNGTKKTSTGTIKFGNLRIPSAKSKVHVKSGGTLSIGALNKNSLLNNIFTLAQGSITIDKKGTGKLTLGSGFSAPSGTAIKIEKGSFVTEVGLSNYSVTLTSGVAVGGDMTTVPASAFVSGVTIVLPDSPVTTETYTLVTVPDNVNLTMPDLSALNTASSVANGTWYVTKSGYSYLLKYAAASDAMASVTIDGLTTTYATVEDAALAAGTTYTITLLKDASWIPASLGTYKINKGGYSLTINSATASENEGTVTVTGRDFYWIGGTSGEWDNGANWSRSEDGSTAGEYAFDNMRVFFKEAATVFCNGTKITADTIDTSADVTIAAQLTGASITKKGSGTLTLVGATAPTTAFNIEAGQVTINNTLNDITPFVDLDAMAENTIVTTSDKVTKWIASNNSEICFTNDASTSVITTDYFGGKQAVLTQDPQLIANYTLSKNSSQIRSMVAVACLVTNVDDGGGYFATKSGQNNVFIGKRNNGDTDWAVMVASKTPTSASNSVIQNGYPSTTVTKGAETVYAFQGYNNNSTTIERLGASKGSVAFGEIIAFGSQTIDAATRIRIESYLANKWETTGIPVTLGTPVPVTLSDGATLDLGGLSRTITSLSGSGTVANGTLTITQPVSVEVGNTLVIPYGPSYSVADTTVATENKTAGTVTFQYKVATVDGTGYGSIAAAKTAAAGEKTITLCANITDTVSLSAGETMLVKKGSYSITVEAAAGSVLSESTDSEGVTTYQATATYTVTIPSVTGVVAIVKTNDVAVAAGEDGKYVVLSGATVVITYSAAPAYVLSDETKTKKIDNISKDETVAEADMPTASRKASTFVWTGAKGDNVWVTPGNWKVDEMAVTVCPGADDTARVDSDATLIITNDLSVSALIANAAVTVTNTAEISLAKNSKGVNSSLNGNKLYVKSISGTGKLILSNGIIGASAAALVTAEGFEVKIADGTVNGFWTTGNDARYLDFHGPLTGGGTVIAYQSNNNCGVRFYGNNSGFYGYYNEQVVSDYARGRTQFNSTDSASSSARWHLKPCDSKTTDNPTFPDSGTYKFGEITEKIQVSGVSPTLEIGAIANGSSSLDGSAGGANIKKVGETSTLTMSASSIGDVEICAGAFILADGASFASTSRKITFTGATASLTTSGLDVSPNLGSSTYPIVIDDSGVDTTWGTAFTTTGGLTKKGEGTLTLDAAAEIGDLTIQAGDVILGDGDKTFGKLTLAEDSTVTVLGAGVMTFASYAAGCSKDSITVGNGLRSSWNEAGTVLTVTRGAQTFVWTGSAGDNLLTTPGNWSVGGLPVAIVPGNDDCILFDSTAAITLTSSSFSVSNVMVSAGAVLSISGNKNLYARMFNGEGSLRLNGGSIGNFSAFDSVISNNIEVVGGTTNSINVGNDGAWHQTTLYGNLSGTGTLRVDEGGQNSAGLQLSSKDNSGFSGSFEVYNYYSAKRSSTRLLTAGSTSSNAVWKLRGKEAANIFQQSNATYYFGALNGSVYEANSYSGMTLEIGARNVDCSFDGPLSRSDDSSHKNYGTKVRKVGTKKLTLDTTNTGTVEINGGTLAFKQVSALPHKNDNGDYWIQFGGGTLEATLVDPSALIMKSASPISVYVGATTNETWETALADSNTAGLTKKGAGTLTLSVAPAWEKTETQPEPITVLAGAVRLPKTMTNFTLGHLTVTNEAFSSETYIELVHHVSPGFTVLFH